MKIAEKSDMNIGKFYTYFYEIVDAIWENFMKCSLKINISKVLLKLF